MIFPQDPGAGGGTADDGGVTVTFREAPQGQFVRPILGGDGVTIADDGSVFRFSQYGNVAEEVEKVGGAGGVAADVGFSVSSPLAYRPSDSGPQV